MTRPLKAHVIEARWWTGPRYTAGVRRHIRCRCGWYATNHNAGYLTDLFHAHRLEAQAAKDKETA